MNDNLEVHLGDKIYEIEVVTVVREGENEQREQWYVARVWDDETYDLLNREEMEYKRSNEEASEWAWNWVRAYHKQHNK